MTRVPTRPQRVDRFWQAEYSWLLSLLGYDALQSAIANGSLDSLPQVAETPSLYQDADSHKIRFWQTALDHYGLFGIDDLEQARTYSAPQFADQFGSFQTLTSRYGGPQLLKSDLEAVKQHLYVRMTL